VIARNRLFGTMDIRRRFKTGGYPPPVQNG
jgi:hypothetical protein